MRVVSYTRVSTTSQVDNGVSLNNQRDKIRSYVELKELYLLEEICDAGISGSKNDRPGFQRIIELCETKQIDGVVIYSLSRFTRSTRDLLDFVDKYVKTGQIQLYSLNENIDTSSPIGKFMITMLGALNELEREQSNQRVKDALQHKKQNGEKLGGYVPYGFDVLDGKLIPNESEKAVINEMKELKEQGLSLCKIAKTLNSRQVPTKVNGKWSHTQIGRILKGE